jgi:hypothetical protein
MQKKKKSQLIKYFFTHLTKNRKKTGENLDFFTLSSEVPGKEVWISGEVHCALLQGE